MKRLVLAVGGTVAGVAALLSFKTQTHPVSNSGSLPSAALTTPAATAGPSSSAAAPTAAVRVRTYLGSAITTRYGIVQVRASVDGSRITQVSFAQLTAFDGHSQQINSDAGPQLLQETLHAQSGHVDTISGASYTSDGYRQSLQSALDRAGMK